ncbi:MAG: DNA polymerase I, partial [Vampirovibrionia bacterium]
DGVLISQSEDFICNSAYIPLGHIFENKQIPLKEALDTIKPLLENTTTSKVLHNAKYDIHVLKNYDINLDNVSMDTMLASYIDDPSNKHGLKHLAMQKFQYIMTEYEELAGKGKNQITLDKVEVDKVAEYACLDSGMTLKLANYYAAKLNEKDQELLYNMEIPLMHVLTYMERNGIGLDTDYLKELSIKLSESLEKLEGQIYEIANYPSKFNLNSPKQLGDVLFEHMGLPAKGKTKTKSGYSTSAKVLETLAKDYEIAQLILEYRHLAKLKSTYIDSLPKLINLNDKRIHTSFNQAITTTGRLSSSDPNLQNIPIRTELGNSIRKAFIPDKTKDNCLLAADYSQIELRFLADLSKEANLIEAFNNNVDVHSSTACKVFGVTLENVTKDMRRKAKAVNFGIIYGQTAYGLSEALDITPGEAKAFIQKYFETYPGVKEYMDKSVLEAHKKGYVVTKFGRKRFFANELGSSNRMIKEFAERAAINSPLQGSAADLIKIAMINLYKKLNELKLNSKMLLQVHDELVLEVPKNELDQVKELVKDCMENACQLSVPLLVDICVGDNWMEAK